MIRFLIKGLIRDRARSLSRILMVTAGVFLTVFMYGFMKGVMSDIIDTNARYNEGHVKIMTRAYSRMKDQVPNDLALLEIQDLMEELENTRPDMLWAARIKFGGLLDIPDEKGQTREQGQVTGLAIDLSREKSLLGIEKALVAGRLPERPGEILITRNLSEKLKAGAGENATFIGSTINGAMAIHNFHIAGLLRFGVTTIDRGTMIAGIEDMRSVMDMPGGASEILGFDKNLFYDNGRMQLLAEEFNSRFSREDDEFSPVMETLGQQAGMGDYIDLAQFAAGIIIAVFIFAMSIVLWNAGLMDGIRRYGEIGVRLAMGESKGEVYRRMIVESAAIGIAGFAAGTALGIAATLYMQNVGWNIGYALQDSTIAITDVIRARVTPLSYVIGFIPGLFASVIGTMFAGIGIYRRKTSELFSELEG